MLNLTLGASFKLKINLKIQIKLKFISKNYSHIKCIVEQLGNEETRS
jgi:hypothetical protein